MTISNKSDLEFLENSPSRGTVTDFHKWVWAKHDKKMLMSMFYKMHPELNSSPAEYEISEKKVKAKMAHAKIQHAQLQFGENFLKYFHIKENSSSNWVPIYIDKHDENPDVLISPKLLVDGVPLRGCPDVVFKNKVTNQVLIVENKVTHVPLKRISEEGYPNVRAQLWAYSWMSQWAGLDDCDVLMGATFWTPDLDGHVRTMAWKRSDCVIKRECEEWFEEYEGEILPNWRMNNLLKKVA